MLNLRSILVAFLLLPLLAAQAESGADILKTSGVKGGFIVHLGCGEGDLTMQLAVGDQYLVHGLDTRPVFDGKLFVALKDGRVLCLK
jgi:hypothetical protein